MSNISSPDKLMGPFTCTVTVAGVEITSKEDWDRVVEKLNELMRENERLCDILRRVYGYEPHKESSNNSFMSIDENSPLGYSPNDFKIVCTELYDDYIRYKGEVIYRGNTKKLSKEQIHQIVRDYDCAQLLNLCSTKPADKQSDTDEDGRPWNIAKPTSSKP